MRLKLDTSWRRERIELMLNPGDEIEVPDELGTYLERRFAHLVQVKGTGAVKAGTTQQDIVAKEAEPAEKAAEAEQAKAEKEEAAAAAAAAPKAKSKRKRSSSRKRTSAKKPAPAKTTKAEAPAK